MDLNINETMFQSITVIDESNSTYMVCYDTPPHIVSDGLWGAGKDGREPMKSFLPLFELQVLIIFAITQIWRFLLKPLRLPLFISQMMAGLTLHTSLQSESLGTHMRKLFPYGTHDTISAVSSIGYVLFIFMNGVQMDFSMITRTGKKAWTIAIFGLVMPFFVAFIAISLFHHKIDKFIQNYADLYVTLISHTTNSFAVIASMLSELQIQNSELGRLALSSALVSDVLCTIGSAIGTALMITPDTHMSEAIGNLLALVALIVFVPLVCRSAMFRIIKHTPEGRPVRDGYLYMIIAMVFLLGWVAVRINQEFVLGVFLFGLSVPEGTPLGSALVKKLQLFGTSFFLPIFVTTCMLKADFSTFLSSNWYLVITFAVLIAHFLKTISCILPALYCNIPIRDSLTLALILNFKGVVEIGTYCFFYDNQFLTGETYGILMISIIIVSSIVQWAVKVLYDPSRKYAGYQKRNMMSLRPYSEVRMVVCIHKPNHSGSMINVLDLCCPTEENPITVDVLHLIELVGRSLPIFIPHHHLQKQDSGFRKSYSDDIIFAFDIYQHENSNAVSAYTYTAISPSNLMYEDVCNLALDKVASIILLPFHRRWSIDGGVEIDDKNIKALNCRVLEIAPCSVGILVTRASHQIRDSSTTTRVALIYLDGSQDDQEALCIAKRAIRNPGVDLVVYHLMNESDFREDDDGIIIEDAYNVEYDQVITMDGSQTADFLRKVANEHDFFIVGRRHGIHTPQTDGLSDWSEFPELGAIGDFLASPDLESHASILVVQQQLSPNTHNAWLF